MSRRESKSSPAAASALEPRSLSEFIEEAYGELHRVAQIQFNGEQPCHTLQPTALVHETFIRLLRTGPKKYVNRAHFFTCATKTMRRVLLDAGRKRRALKRGGRLERVPLEDAELLTQELPDYTAIDAVLSRLHLFDQKLARIVELRVFARLTVRETAEVLGMGQSTVRKRWGLAEAWLKREIQQRSHG